MPEFEEDNKTNKEGINYSPRNEPKTRSRRRSGGFKNDYSTSSNPSIGEIDPSSIVRDATPQTKLKDINPKPCSSQETQDLDSVDNSPGSNSQSKARYEKSNAKPKVKPESKRSQNPLNQETLRVIQELEEKISEKKQARATRQADKRGRGKKRATKGPFAALAGLIAGLFGKKKVKGGNRHSKRSGQGQGRSRKRYSNKKRR